MKLVVKWWKAVVQQTPQKDKHYKHLTPLPLTLMIMIFNDVYRLLVEYNIIYNPHQPPVSENILQSKFGVSFNLEVQDNLANRSFGDPSSGV